MRPTFLWEYQFSWQILIVNILVTIISVFGYRDHHQDHYPRTKFIESETNFTFHRGDTAKLSCGVMDLGTKSVAWRRNESLQALAIGEMIFESSPDYEVHHPEGSFFWNLLIKNVQPKHAGMYECQVTTKDKLKKMVQLNVIDDKKFSDPAGKPKPRPEKPISEREVGGPDGGQLQEQNMAGYNSSGSSSFLGNNSLKYLNTAVFVAACLLLLFQNRR